MNDDIANYIRSFGMSGLLITDELNRVESMYNIDLRHAERPSAEDPLSYYPQFEQTVRAEAAAMSEYYELFYCLERSIRKLIVETLAEAEDTAWWDSGRVPQKIRDAVAERAQKELDSGVTRRSDEPIDYTTFGELSVIITSNWDLFGPVFTTRRAVERVMSSLNLLRGPIAHCCPITEDEVDRLRLTVKDWFRMLG